MGHQIENKNEAEFIWAFSKREMKPVKREIEMADMVAETTQRRMIAGMEYGLHGDGVGIHTFNIFVRYSQALSKQNPLSLYVCAQPMFYGLFFLN